jgi:putative sterol carrier protein
MSSAQEFFNTKFAAKVAQDPGFMQKAGVRGKNIAVDIDGARGGQWTFMFDGEGMVAMKPGAENADCVIMTSDKTFEGMLAGTVNVPMAFLMRKIKVKGENSLAMKLGLALQESFLKS